MENEKNIITTPRFGIHNDKIKINDDKNIKQLLKLENNYKSSETKKREKSKSKNKSPKKEKKEKVSKIKDLSSKEFCEEFLKKKFKLRNDFDHDHTEIFLLDKENAMENIELTDEIYD